MNINAERQCRRLIDTAIQGVDDEDAMAALITALVDHAMTLEKDGEPISAPEVKQFLGEIIGQVVDVCFSFDGKSGGTQCQ